MTCNRDLGNLFMTYQFRGGLPSDAPSYVTRLADQELYELLMTGQFCHVFNARQVGKSSLRIRLMQRLQANGIACVDIDLTEIGIYQVTPLQWYGSLIGLLVDKLKLRERFDHQEWLSEQQKKASTAPYCFRKFIEEILLQEILQPLVIFIDEIDYILKLEFKEDFFALIRACYEKRTNRINYKRITFVLLGVATPTDLMGSNLHPSSSTPFDISHSIELCGFQLSEVQPLINGLTGIASNPTAALQTILSWTGGQPFLTQKLCHLVCEAGNFIPEGQEGPHIETLVRSRVIKNWESHDDPQHLKTICDRILVSGEQRTGRLLGLYQQILQEGAIAADSSPEQMELRLSGLVVKQGNTLKAYNNIYTQVFNEKWVSDELEKLRPYAESFNAWAISDCKDESRLLRGNTLEDARNWSEGKSLSDLDYKFLSESQKLEQQEVQRKLEAQTEANQILETAREKAIRISIGAFIALAASIAISGLILNRAKKFEQQAALIDVNLSQQAAQAALDSRDPFDALFLGLKAAQKLKQLDKSLWKQNHTQLEGLTGLYRVVYSVKEKNTLEHESDLVYTSFTPDGQALVTSSGNGLNIWKINGSFITTLDGDYKKEKRLTYVDFDFNSNGKTIITASSDGTVNFWKLDGTNIRTIKVHPQSISSIAFSPDHQMMVTESRDRNLKIWKSDGTLFKTLTGENYVGNKFAVRSIAYSPDGKLIALALISLTDDNIIIKLLKNDGTLLKTLTGQRDLNKVFKLTSNKMMGAELFTAGGIRFSPNNKVIAVASLDGTVRLWRNDGKMIPLAGHSDIITDFNFSPDGQTIATASIDKTLKLWKLDGTLLQTFTGHSGGVRGVSFSPDSKLLISTSGDRTIKLWRLDGRVEDTLYGHRGAVNQAFFAKDGETIISMSEDNTVKIWRWKGVPYRKVVDRGLQAFAADKKLAKTKFARKYDPSFGEKTAKGKITNLEFSSDSKILATASEDGKIKIWKSDGTLLHTLFKEDIDGGHGSIIRDYSSNIAVFHPNATVIASVKGDNTIQLWKIDGTYLDTLDAPGSRIIRYSPDGKMLATDAHLELSDRNSVTLFKENGTIISKLIGHSDRIVDISFSPDSKTVATASDDKTLRLWKTDGNLVNTIKIYSKKVEKIIFSPDGKTILSLGQDIKPNQENQILNEYDVIKLWETNGKLIKRITGDSYEFKNVTFSPDGQIIATSGNSSVKLWTLDGKQVMEYRTAYGKEPGKIAFSPDGRFLAVAYDDGTVEIKDASLDGLIALGCDWIKDYLNTHSAQKQSLEICQDKVP